MVYTYIYVYEHSFWLSQQISVAIGNLPKAASCQVNSNYTNETLWLYKPTYFDDKQIFQPKIYKQISKWPSGNLCIS